MAKAARSNGKLFSAISELGLRRNAKTLLDESKALIANQRSVLDSVASAKTAAFDSTFRILADAEGHTSANCVKYILPSLVHSDEDVRKASAEAKAELSKLWGEMEPEVYNVLKQVPTEDLSEQQKRVVEFYLNKGKRQGLDLEPDILKEYQSLREQIRKLEEEFCKNINEDTSTIILSKEQLSGVPDTFFSNLEKLDDGKFKMKLLRSFAVQSLTFVDDPETRRLIYEAKSRRCMEVNKGILAKLVELRLQAAKMLGFESHGDFRISETMAGTLSDAQKFITELYERLKSYRDLDFEWLLRSKKEHFESMGLPEPIELHSWDRIYYKNKIELQKYSVDAKLVKEYFPLDHVKEQTFQIYSKLFSLNIREVKDCEKWYEEVELYEIQTADSGVVLGHFFLDMHPRNGKYGHACIYPVSPAFTTVDGDRQLPICAMLTNIPKGEPTLLMIDDVRTFFHEFGHIVHCIVSGNAEGGPQYSCLSWTWGIVPWFGGVEMDYLEVPSMSLEKFMDVPDILKQISCHYKTKESLPDEIIENILGVSSLCESSGECRYLAMAHWDLEVHSANPPKDIYERYDELMEEMGGSSPVENSDGTAAWYHPAMGYDASYYGYGYSDVYAYHVFEFFKNAKTDEEKIQLGTKFREVLLTPAGAKAGRDMLDAFLESELDMEPFFAHMTASHAK